VEYKGTLRDLNETEWVVLQSGRNPLSELPACNCSYEESEEMIRHAPLCDVTKGGLNW
jgi:hypothetical protein